MFIIKLHIKFLTGAFLLACAVLLYACREKYIPQLQDINPNYLVIDGFINTGGDSTIFKISRTFKIDNKATIAPERNVIVTVENDGGMNFLLSELASKPGVYAIPNIGQDHTKTYRLRVKTKDGKEYLSDFVESKVSQPVDISYDVRRNNLYMLANSYDPSGKSKYYRFVYEETWEYTAPLKSYLKVVNNGIGQRSFPQDDIFTCYRTVKSGRVALVSTEALNQDRVADFQLEVIPEESQKIRIEYSMYVEQYVLTKAGFDFFETLRKNTEQVGSIFDSQPSQLFGNIRCTNAQSQPVIGFISAGTVSKKRVLYLAKDLPFRVKGNSLNGCTKDTVRANEISRVISDPGYIPLERGEGGLLFATGALCADCRLQGGSLVAPPFWIK